LGDAGRWAGGLFQGAPNLWILYNGTHVIGYEGKEGNTSKQIGRANNFEVQQQLNIRIRRRRVVILSAAVGVVPNV
jgi:hypothetical protein